MSQFDFLKVDNLYFDYKNPRLVEFEEINKQSTDQEVIEVLWDAMDVKELILSISNSGYFKNDPLIVCEEEGKNIVIEGNRRLAAVKILLNPSQFSQWDIPHINSKIKDEIKSLPVYFMDRKVLGILLASNMLMVLQNGIVMQKRAI